MKRNWRDFSTEEAGGKLKKYVFKNCGYCRREMQPIGSLRPTTDHIVPKSRSFGRNYGTVICCAECNNDKAAMTPMEWMKRLKDYNDELSALRLKFIPEAIRNNCELGLV